MVELEFEAAGGDTKLSECSPLCLSGLNQGQLHAF